MSIDLTFDGSTEARGRNRWFQLREVEISHWPQDHSVCVYFYSKTRGEMAPIVLHFHRSDELLTLIEGLKKAYFNNTWQE